ncbi:uncharacterized protein LOC131428982 [Malaya genurostris]|uniref:uncharacterized protein LOC131428982 n=1 Tax=Malaya genurostris TaxID=325434 RepID=UPI0026F381AE|nr:uncharacterized protein LOC131428982 [Malaya genurostris]
MASDQTTDGFIASLRRLVARRCRPEIVMCDNAKYFVGAKRELDQLRLLFNSQTFTNSIPQAAANEGINFKFIPPRAPNFGGLWEAAVKSMKYHLKRTLGTDITTPDEFNTLLTQIEACLNSRPLVPISNDPSDLDVLTPAHFLIHRLIDIYKPFGKSGLQQQNLTEGMVLVNNDNQPPLRWVMGRIIEVHIGGDRNVRVVKVKTKHGLYTRAISKICVLPIEDNETPVKDEHIERQQQDIQTS